VIRLRLSPGDLERLRFAYSPLAEVAESLYVLHSGQIPALHQLWYQRIRKELNQVDLAVLRAIVPAPRPHVASFLLAGAREPSTSIDEQLAGVAACPADRLRADLEVVWRGELPAETKRILQHGGAQRIADALGQYWRVAIRPYWPQIRAVLDADVAYRASRLARGGIEALLADLHPELELAEHAIHVRSTQPQGPDHHLGGAGLLLVPCVFAWPHVMADLGGPNTPSITFAPRGIGNLWPAADVSRTGAESLGALLGRSRAAILLSLALPRSTSDLAADLQQSMPAVSAHLAVLRRSGLVTSWRAGRRVLYRRTPLATSVIAAGDTDPELDQEWQVVRGGGEVGAGGGDATEAAAQGR
jgi:DNA-binding transcriptional ArsR family regulator